MLNQDYDLQATEVSNLAGRDQIRDFFGLLGYPTERGRQTSPSAEGMSEQLKGAIDHIEVVASDESSLLDIYLIELRSVTVANIHTLTTHFKSRGGNSLAVLTSDYNAVDFVLFDRSNPERGSGTATVQAIPRRITVNRSEAADDRIVLRVLRRFSWTTPNAIAQWEKLRSAFSIGEWSDEFFDNRGLFADYYLRERLPEEKDDWADDKLGLARTRIGTLVASARANLTGDRSINRRKCQEELIEPVLSELGFGIVRCDSAFEDAPCAPDYELTDPESGKKLAVCLAYGWDRNLDGPDWDDDKPNENPGAAVVSLLAEEDNEWAILTNGKHWRIYTQKTESRATNFYQVDLEEAAADLDARAFRYFWILFRAAAFHPRKTVVEGEERSLNLLSQLLEGSREYAKEVGDRLKKRVFEDVAPVLAEGFIADVRAHEGHDVELEQERLDLIFNSTLVLLYRVLFLLYAESRDLLPVREVGGYYEKSLTCLKQAIAEEAGKAEGQVQERLTKAYSDDPSESGAGLYDHLSELFTIVADGRSSVNMPPYNGGLFVVKSDDAMDEREQEIAEFLSDHSVPDYHLALAIDHLARDPDEKTHGLVMIDYKSLGVRQLGSIYEGLLEFKLRIAREKMAVCTSKGSEVVLPYAEAKKKSTVTIKRRGRGRDAPEHVLPTGTVYIENSKHERKASGSYYTPDYIVSYIVEHTVGPVLEEKLEGLRRELDRACQTFHKLRRDRGDTDEKRVYGVFEEEKPLIDDLFDFKVLDPAMGSGHFLVTAVDFIADRLIQFLNGFPGNPVERMLRKTRHEIVAAAKKAEIVVDEGKLTDVNLLKRHVLKRCIYGVDLNPMAVELAKVSLWLHCFTLGAPLSFLDHHLKHGNSLIGEMTTGEVLESGQQQLGGTSTWHEFTQAVSNYMMVASLADATADQVSSSRSQFREAEDILKPYRQKLNVQTAGWFVEKSKKKREIWTGKADQRHTEEGQKHWEEAQKLAEEHTFFHWPLEFPEVWYGIRPGTSSVIGPQSEDKAGFDVVVGNPPYDVLPAGTVKEWWPAGRNNNLYGQFIVRGGDLVGMAGGLGLVVPLSFACGDRFEDVRCSVYRRFGRLLSSHYSIRPGKAFPEVDQRATIFCALDKGSSRCHLHSSRLHRFQQWQAAEVVQKPDIAFVGQASNGVIPKTAGKIGADLYNKLTAMPYVLGDLIDEEGSHYAYYHAVARYWVRALDFKPYFLRNAEPAMSSNTKVVPFASQEDLTTFVLLVNSSLFYYWWITQSDEFHVLSSEIRGFRMPWGSLPEDEMETAYALVDSLMESYRRTAGRKTLTVGGNKVEMDEFFARECLPEIQAIDQFIALQYDLTAREQSFLSEYDMVWRSDDDGSDADGE